MYAIIMFGTAVLFAVLAVLIYKGKTQLIHDYHQTNVTDQKGYGKAFGKAMAVIAGAMALSGAVALFGERAMGIAVTVLTVGMIAGFIAIFRVQKKYNGGMF
jgi:hypothetical protein